MTLAQRIAEAETALHELMTGKAVVEVVDQNGERVRYSVANRQALQNYIQTLKADLAAEVAGTSPVTGPLRFWW
ncbi:head-to-tail joining protein [Rhizobium phage RHph_X2_30]|nr:head-to-tail joining protein [Rhizobium phage RHph_X2_30]